MQNPLRRLFMRPTSLFRYRVYRRLAILLFVLLATITLVISTSLYALYAETTIEQTALAQSETLSHVSYFADTLWDELDSFASMLFVNNDMFAFLRGAEDDPVLRYHAYIALRPYRALYPHIRNISLVNFNQSAIVKTNTIFNDEETLQNFLASGKETDRRFGREIETDINGRRSVLSVLTIVYPYYTDSMQTMAGIVFDIDQSYLVSTLYDKEESRSSLMIVDGEGSIISTRDESLFMSHAPSGDYIQLILGGEAGGGYLLANGEAGRVLVTYSKIPQTDWYLIHSQPLSLILAPATRMLAVTILISLLVLCIGICISLVSLKRTFRAAHSLFGILPTVVPAGEDEFSSLSAYMQSMQVEMQSMQQFMSRSALNGLFFGLEQNSEAIDKLQARLNGKSYCVGYTFCEGVANDSGDTVSLMESFVDMLQERLIDILPFDWVAWNDGVLLLFVLGSTTLQEPLLIELESAIQSAGNHCKHFVQVALSDTVPHLTDVHAAFMQANHIATYQLYYENELVLMPKYTQGHAQSTLPDVQEAVHEAAKAIFAEDGNALLHTLNNYVSETLRLTPADFRVSMRTMLTSIGEVVLRGVTDDIAETLRLAIEHVANMPTISEVKSALQAFAQLSIHIAKTQRASTALHGATMQRVYAYVESFYANPDLGINDVAASINLSSNYLGRMFKAYNSLSFTDYLLKIRLEKAELLLKETDITVYKIAEQVGIPNPSYFSHKFKKWYGLTPQQYRNRHTN